MARTSDSKRSSTSVPGSGPGPNRTGSLPSFRRMLRTDQAPGSKETAHGHSASTSAAYTSNPMVPSSPRHASSVHSGHNGHSSAPSIASSSSQQGQGGLRRVDTAASAASSSITLVPGSAGYPLTEEDIDNASIAEIDKLFADLALDCNFRALPVHGQTHLRSLPPEKKRLLVRQHLMQGGRLIHSDGSTSVQPESPSRHASVSSMVSPTHTQTTPSHRGSMSGTRNLLHLPHMGSSTSRLSQATRSSSASSGPSIMPVQSSAASITGSMVPQEERPEWFVQQIMNANVTKEFIQTLGVQIRTKPVGWVDEFVRNQGQLALAKKLSGLNHLSHPSDAEQDREYEFIKCFKSMYNVRKAVDEAMRTPFVLRTLLRSMVSRRLQTAKLATDIYTFFVCNDDIENRLEILLNAFDIFVEDELKSGEKVPNRFRPWLDHVKAALGGRGIMGSMVGASREVRSSGLSAESLLAEYSLSTVVLARELVDNPNCPHLQNRIHLRAQLRSAHIRDAFTRMRRLQQDRINQAIELYEEHESLDAAELDRADEESFLNINEPVELAKHLDQRVEGSSDALNALVSMLQHLLLVRQDDKEVMFKLVSELVGYMTMARIDPNTSGSSIVNFSMQQLYDRFMTDHAARNAYIGQNAALKRANEAEMERDNMQRLLSLGADGNVGRLEKKNRELNDAIAQLRSHVGVLEEQLADAELASSRESNMRDVEFAELYAMLQEQQQASRAPIIADTYTGRVDRKRLLTRIARQTNAEPLDLGTDMVATKATAAPANRKNRDRLKQMQSELEMLQLAARELEHYDGDDDEEDQSRKDELMKRRMAQMKRLQELQHESNDIAKYMSEMELREIIEKITISAAKNGKSKREVSETIMKLVEPESALMTPNPAADGNGANGATASNGSQTPELGSGFDQPRTSNGKRVSDSRPRNSGASFDPTAHKRGSVNGTNGTTGSNGPASRPVSAYAQDSDSVHSGSAPNGPATGHVSAYAQESTDAYSEDTQPGASNENSAATADGQNEDDATYVAGDEPMGPVSGFGMPLTGAPRRKVSVSVAGGRRRNHVDSPDINASPQPDLFLDSPILERPPSPAGPRQPLGRPMGMNAALAGEILAKGRTSSPAKSSTPQPTAKPPSTTKPPPSKVAKADGPPPPPLPDSGKLPPKGNAPPPPPLPAKTGGPPPPPPPPLPAKVGGPPPPPPPPPGAPPLPKTPVMPSLGASPILPDDIGTPRTNKKLKQIHWERIENVDQTIWARLQRPGEPAMADLLQRQGVFDEIERIFAQKEVKKFMSTAQEEREKKISLLPRDISQHFEINFHMFSHLPVEEVVDKVLQCTPDVMEQTGLLEFFASKDATEVSNAMLRSFEPYSTTDWTGATRPDKDPEKLARTDRIFLELCFNLHSYWPVRTRGLLVSQMFEKDFHSLSKRLTSIDYAADAAGSSHNFQKVLEMILVLGNYMNNRAKQAQGFRLATLQRLAFTKDEQNSMSLMHYVEKTVRCGLTPEIASFADDLQPAVEVSRVAIDNLRTECQEYIASIRKLASSIKAGKLSNPDQLHPRDKCLDVIHPAMAEAVEKARLLEDHLKLTEAKLDKTMSLYGEDPSDATAVATFFNKFASFVQEYQTAHTENEIRERDARLYEARKKQLEEAAAKQRKADEEKADGRTNADALLEKLKAASVSTDARASRRRAALRQRSITEPLSETSALDAETAPKESTEPTDDVYDRAQQMLEQMRAPSS